MNRCYWSNLIPSTPKTLPYLNALLDSLEEYTVADHDFYIVLDGYAEDDAADTYKYLRRRFKNIYLKDYICVNHKEFSLSINEAFGRLVTTPWVMVWHDDMVVGPSWDAELWQAIRRNGNSFIYTMNTVDSGRAFFPSGVYREVAPNSVSMPPVKNLGYTPNDFEYEQFREFCWQQQQVFEPGSVISPNAWYTPFILESDLFSKIGGYSFVEPYPYPNDVVFFAGLERIGIKGVAAPRSVAYHYGSASWREFDGQSG